MISACRTHALRSSRARREHSRRHVTPWGCGGMTACAPSTGTAGSGRDRVRALPATGSTASTAGPDTQGSSRRLAAAAGDAHRRQAGSAGNQAGHRSKQMVGGVGAPSYTSPFCVTFNTQASQDSCGVGSVAEPAHPLALHTRPTPTHPRATQKRAHRADTGTDVDTQSGTHVVAGAEVVQDGSFVQVGELHHVRDRSQAGLVHLSPASAQVSGAAPQHSSCTRTPGRAGGTRPAAAPPTRWIVGAPGSICWPGCCTAPWSRRSVGGAVGQRSAAAAGGAGCTVG